jgi:nicotinamidase-related amidase
MSTPPSSHAPLIVIDLQTGMFDGVVAPPLHDAEGLVRRVRSVLDWARRSGRGVAFIRQNSPPGDQLEPGAPGWRIWPAIGARPEEPVFDKTVENAFSNSALHPWITQRGADEVVVVGAATGHCVASTIAGALEAGLRVTLVADGHSTGGSDDAAAVIAEHNRRFAAAGVNLITAAELKLPGQAGA